VRRQTTETGGICFTIKQDVGIIIIIITAATTNNNNTLALQCDYMGRFHNTAFPFN
jgi:hypothetical protein